MTVPLEAVWSALRRSDRPHAAMLATALGATHRAVAEAVIAADAGAPLPEADVTADGWLGSLAAGICAVEPPAQEAHFADALRQSEDDPGAGYEIHMARARARHQRRTYGPALTDARVARGLARTLNDAGREAWALSAAGAALVELRDYPRGRAVHEAAYALHTAAGQPGGEVASLGGLGLCALGRHETARGAESLHRAVAAARALGLAPEERAWLSCVAHAMALLDRNDARRDALVRLATLEAESGSCLRAAAAWIDAATAATAILGLDDAEADLANAAACYARVAHTPGLADVTRRLTALREVRATLPARRARWTAAVTLDPTPLPTAPTTREA